jgi:hypothetical protein
VNETGKRKLPDDVPLDFISNRWNKYVFEPDGNINRHYYEIAAYTELKNRIRSGDITVNGSRNYTIKKLGFKPSFLKMVKFPWT